MKTLLTTFTAFLLTSSFLFSCKNESKPTEVKQAKTEDINKPSKQIDPSKVVMAIDSNSIRLNKNKIPNFKVTKEVEPSSSLEIMKMVSDLKTSDLNENQKFIQSFLSACANKNAQIASSSLAYNGNDTKRKNIDHYRMTNPNEIKIVQSTMDVIYNLLAESSTYKYVSYNKNQGISTIEVSFFKKGLGINRRYFDVLDTPKGKLIIGMR